MASLAVECMLVCRARRALRLQLSLWQCAIALKIHQLSNQFAETLCSFSPDFMEPSRATMLTWLLRDCVVGGGVRGLLTLALGLKAMA